MKSKHNNRPARRPTESKPVSPEAKRRLVVVLALSLFLLILYFSVQSMAEDGTLPRAAGYAIMILYMVSFAGLLIGYLLYNRAFVNKDVTVDMLPDDWSDEKKQDFVEGNRRRAEKSRWLLYLLIPFIFVFMAEALYLFLWMDNLENFFK